MKRSSALAGLVPAAFLLSAASGYYITPSKNRILPGDDSIAPGSEFTVGKGDIFYRRPVGRSFVAELGGDLQLTIAGKTATLAKGMQLNVARTVGGTAAERLGEAGVFCAPMERNWNAAKGIANLLTLSLFASAQRTEVNTQFCLADSDADGLVDKAFLAGAKKQEDLQPIDITPTPISVERDLPLPGLSEIRLRFSGKVGWFNNIGIDLEVVESGEPLFFNNGRTVISMKKLPEEVNLFGASFTVLSYDPETKQARIRWNRGFAPGEYGVTTTTTTTYIPVYVPR
ncbi:hypothetical protein [Allosphingosinicella deserti]|uniref:Uncharacterized protein n=1 Tax=Allosphingosinicella deserti TaxID=2116704 RepID=A0A2P7QYY1_9SPHN|nr:hypothetical protein [Sphingomonas deserti]PSJ43159.1 hypothetical protein C7I55_01870 [Sphingomonas deserti]